MAGQVADLATWKTLLASSVRSGPFVMGWGNGAYGGGAPMIGQSAFNRPQAQNGTITPPTAMAPDYTHVQALARMPRLPGSSSGKLWLAEMEYGYSLGAAAKTGCLLVLDRLSQTAPVIRGDITTAQTIGTPALTRYTSGEGVMAFLEMTANIAFTAGSTATISYTNQAGVSGCISQPILFGSTGISNIDQTCVFPLAAGDTGVRSVESLTVAGAVLGATTTFAAIVLAKPLAFSPNESTVQLARSAYKNYLEGMTIAEIMPAACLATILVGYSTNTGAMAITGRLGIVEAP